MTKLIDLSQEDLECLQIGRSMKLRSMSLAVRILQEQMAVLERQLAGGPGNLPAVNGPVRPAMQRTLEAAGIAPEGLPVPAKKKRGRPRGGIKGYWAKMTPAERSVEMKRRRGMHRAAKKPFAQPNHPRNANHPKHKEWLAKMKKAMRKSWESLTPTVREERIKAALGGRGVKRKTPPTVKLKR